MDERMEGFFRARRPRRWPSGRRAPVASSTRPTGPIAVFVTLEWDGTVGLYNSGFQPERAPRCRPGSCCSAHVIRDAIERGKRRFDFLRGEERYKYEFGPTPEAVHAVTIGARRVSLRVAMLSVHTCPLAALGGKETGGMNVYVRELARELGRMGVARRRLHPLAEPAIPRVVALGEGARVIHLAAGTGGAACRASGSHDHLDEFVDGVEAWRIARGLDYDLIHAHYWLSGVVGLALRERWAVPRRADVPHAGPAQERAWRAPAPSVEPALRHRRGGAHRGRRRPDRRRQRGGARAPRARTTAPTRARIAVIPCGVDTDAVPPRRPGRGPRRARARRPARCCSTWAASRRSRGSTRCSTRMARLRAAGRRVQLCIVGGDADEPLNGHEGAAARASGARSASATP